MKLILEEEERVMALAEIAQALTTMQIRSPQSQPVFRSRVVADLVIIPARPSIAWNRGRPPQVEHRWGRNIRNEALDKGCLSNNMPTGSIDI